MEPLDISFYGGMGSGKSTCAKYLAKNNGYIHLSMATALKDAAVRIWGESARTDRDKLQKLGKYVREIYENSFMESFTSELEAERTTEAAVVDDMRYANEFWGLKRLGFVMVEVRAPEESRVDRLLRIGKLDDVSQLEDETETQLYGAKAESEGISPDFVITNDGELDDLYQQVRDVLLKIDEGASA